MECTKYEIAENKVLKVIQDNQGSCGSPREWDNLAKMLFFGKHSYYGDKHEHKIQASHYNGWGELKAAIMDAYDVACIVPVYGYEHSGMTIATTPFNCSWDSGQLGFAIVTKKDLRNNYSIKRCTKKFIEYGINHINGEVKTLDQYITGDIWGFQVVDKDNEENIIDSCWGFFGSDIKTNGILDNILEEDRKIIEESLK